MRTITNEPPEKSLNTLIENVKNDHKSVTKEVRRNLNLVDEARQERIPWSKIADALGFPGKFREVEKAYRKEKQNQKTEKKIEEVMAEKKKEIMPDAKAKIQKESVAFSSEEKAKSGRIGSPKPIGRGRLDLGEDTPDDEL